jgi:ATP synthase protein I
MTDRLDLDGHGEQRDAAEEAPIKPLTREEVQALSAKHPPISPWRVVVMQVTAGLVVTLLAYVITGRGETAWSALYGAAAVVMPSALLARGITRRSSRGDPGAMVFGFMLWEFMKIGLAVAMLVAAAKVVPNLSWPALLVAMVVCMKVNWLALLWRGRTKNNQSRSDNR